MIIKGGDGRSAISVHKLVRHPMPMKYWMGSSKVWFSSSSCEYISCSSVVWNGKGLCKFFKGSCSYVSSKGFLKSYNQLIMTHISFTNIIFTVECIQIYLLPSKFLFFVLSKAKKYLVRSNFGSWHSFFTYFKRSEKIISWLPTFFSRVNVPKLPISLSRIRTFHYFISARTNYS